MPSAKAWMLLNLVACIVLVVVLAQSSSSGNAVESGVALLAGFVCFVAVSIAIGICAFISRL